MIGGDEAYICRVDAEWGEGWAVVVLGRVFSVRRTEADAAVALWVTVLVIAADMGADIVYETVS